MLKKQVLQDGIIILDLPRPSKEKFLSPKNGDGRTSTVQMGSIQEQRDAMAGQIKTMASATRKSCQA